MPDANPISSAPQCPACGQFRSRPAFVKDGFRHFACRACATLFVHPAPTLAEVAALYQDPAGGPVSSICWASDRGHCRDLWDWSLKIIRGEAGTGPLLDVGCGAGQFLEHARHRGWRELAGVEPSAEAARAARARTGLEILAVPLPEAGLPAAHFAGVVLWDVIEHLADACAMMREILRLLRPGGVLVLSAPNRGGLTLRLLGARALVVMPPEHLTYFSARGLRIFLAAEGFTVRRVRTMDVYLREWTRVLRGKTAEGTGRSEAERESYQRDYKAVTGGRLFPLAMRAANLALDLAGLGDQLVAAARKPL